MLMINPVLACRKRNNISFEKTVKQIITEAPNKELKKLIKKSTDSNESYVVERGLPDLFVYSKKGEVEKQQVIQTLKDLIESEEVQSEPASENLLNGISAFDGDLVFPGYTQIYDYLTKGKKINAAMVVGYRDNAVYKDL
jgi:hypothetical protein